jgi:hypothetical protein
LATAISDLGIAEDAPAELLKMARGLLGRSTPPDLRYALDLLQTICATGRRVVVFIDEIGNVASWDDNENAAVQLSSAMRAHTPRPAFIFAGSRQEPINALGNALLSETLPFPLPKITKSAWEVELKARFGEANVAIDDPRVHEILFHSEGHPQDTMRLCSHCATWARSSAGVVDHDVIEIALGDAKSNPLWGQR